MRNTQWCSSRGNPFSVADAEPLQLQQKSMGLSTEHLVEYAALLKGCGFVELRHWSSIIVTGADRQTFLNNFCTNDVKKLSPGRSCEAFFTNVKGKIVGHGLVMCRDEALAFVGPPGQAAPLIAHLEKYIIREDVQLKDSTSELEYALLAKGDTEVAARLGSIPSRSIPWNVLNLPACSLLEIASEALAEVQHELKSQKVTRCDEIVFQTRRIEAGFPLFGVDFDEQNLPQEIGRDAEAISFQKGCYLGQETVARIDALGHVNQQLCGVRFFSEEVPALGLELTLADSVVGQVTSAAFSPQFNAPLALAMVRRAASAIGAKLESLIGGCEVVKLPVPALPVSSSR